MTQHFARQQKQTEGRSKICLYMLASTIKSLKAVSEPFRTMHCMSAMLCFLSYWKPKGLSI